MQINVQPPSGIEIAETIKSMRREKAEGMDR